MCSHVQSCGSVPVSGVHCHVRASSTEVVLCVFTVQSYTEDNSTASISSPGRPEATEKAEVRKLVPLYSSRYCTLRLKWFSLILYLFLTYHLCEKYKATTVQYYIADCVSWVPRLTSLDSRTIWTYEHAHRTRLYVGDILYAEVSTLGPVTVNLLDIRPSEMYSGKVGSLERALIQYVVIAVVQLLSHV